MIFGHILSYSPASVNEEMAKKWFFQKIFGDEDLWLAEIKRLVFVFFGRILYDIQKFDQLGGVCSDQSCQFPWLAGNRRV